jgi:hypothetical protein
VIHAPISFADQVYHQRDPPIHPYGSLARRRRQQGRASKGTWGADIVEDLGTASQDYIVIEGQALGHDTVRPAPKPRLTSSVRSLWASKTVGARLGSLTN